MATLWSDLSLNLTSSTSWPQNPFPRRGSVDGDDAPLRPLVRIRNNKQRHLAYNGLHF